MALALYDMDNDPLNGLEVVFAPSYTQVTPKSDYLGSRVFVLDHAGTAGSFHPDQAVGTNFLERNGDGTPIGDPGTQLDPGKPFDFPGYGASGIAVADLVEEPPLTTTKPEIIVTTANGELIVLRWNPDLNQMDTLQFIKLEGAIGLFNSIVIEDLVPTGGDGVFEVYVAGSDGIRRFDVVTP